MVHMRKKHCPTPKVFNKTDRGGIEGRKKNCFDVPGKEKYKTEYDTDNMRLTNITNIYIYI